MRRFRFSLETVLKVKRQIEEQRLLELAQVQAQRDVLMKNLGEAEKHLAELNTEQAGQRQGKLDLNAETWFRQRHLRLNQVIRMLRRNLAENDEHLEAARARVVEAARERKVLEKLEEQQRQEHQLKSNREEQGFMDELAQHAASQMAYASPSANGR